MQRPTKTPSGIRVPCRLEKCIHFTPDPRAQAGWCACTHPDKHQHMGNPCPLYRMDWKGTGIMDMF